MSLYGGYKPAQLWVPTSGSTVQLEPAGYASGSGYQDIRVRNLTVSGTASFADVSATRFLAGNGTNNAPSFTFTSDPDTGVYRVGADQLGLTAGGSLGLTVEAATVTINAVQLLASAGGAVGNPAISFSGDTNTGFYSIAGGQVGFSSDGTLVASFLAGGIELAAAKVLSVAGSQVVKARIGGWQQWTGAASRLARDTAAATLGECAQAIKALTDDLGLTGVAATSHGLIGA